MSIQFGKLIARRNGVQQTKDQVLLDGMRNPKVQAAAAASVAKIQEALAQLAERGEPLVQEYDRDPATKAPWTNNDAVLQAVVDQIQHPDDPANAGWAEIRKRPSCYGGIMQILVVAENQQATASIQPGLSPADIRRLSSGVDRGLI